MRKGKISPQVAGGYASMSQWAIIIEIEDKINIYKNKMMWFKFIN